MKQSIVRPIFDCTNGLRREVNPIIYLVKEEEVPQKHKILASPELKAVDTMDHW